MRHTALWATIAAMLLVGVGEANAVDVALYQVTYPERNEIEVDFARDSRAPEATMTAEVKYHEGQADMNIRFRGMKPAILFGGDVTCYVLWAVTRDGTAENLGELWVRQESDTVEYSTGLKSFAMMVTAEPHPLVSAPSELVLFRSQAAKSKKSTSEEFIFSGFVPAPAIEYPSVAKVIWDENQPLDLRQAEKAYELALAAGAEDYAPSQLRRSFTILSQARNFASANKSKSMVDYSRRSLALSAEALQVTAQRKQAEAVEAEIARRKAEMDALNARADEAEASAAAAATALQEAKRSIEEVQRSKAEAEAAVLAAQGELTRIEAERTALVASVASLEQQSANLERERADLAARLQGALSMVAETQQSARGMIVSLPDILFDTNEATLKNEAKIVIAKLAGILLILPDLNLRVEGHTDSTGSAEYNQELSERRAMSVRDFLAQQGVAANRMVAVGYGLTRPVADNSTREGRAKNRRVEIVIAQGEVAAE
jgi:outer membrane protein OmpA-like peptidoglycan-associated protein